MIDKEDKGLCWTKNGPDDTEQNCRHHIWSHSRLDFYDIFLFSRFFRVQQQQININLQNSVMKSTRETYLVFALCICPCTSSQFTYTSHFAYVLLLLKSKIHTEVSQM